MDSGKRKANSQTKLNLDNNTDNNLTISILYWNFIFSVAGAMGICFPYLGEFQPTKYREKILCWMEMFWTMGIIALPGKSIIIL